MGILKKPGASLFLVGLLSLFIVRPIVDGLWGIGGLLGGIALIIGLFGIFGGGYLVARSMGFGR